MIEMTCINCNADLIFPDWLTFEELRAALEEHGCQPRRVRWDGTVVEATIQ